MAAIEMKNIVKTYGDGFPAVNDVSIDVADGEFVILVGPSGCGKSTLAAHDRRPRGHHLGRDDHRRRARERQGAARAQPVDGVPELRPLPPPVRLREHRVPAAPLQEVQRRGDRREGAQGERDPRARRAPRPQARQPVWRPAPARRDGPGDRARRPGVPVRRAALQPRRQAARPDAHRDRAAAEEPRDHDGLRHPRPDRGHDARRPGRRAEARPAAAAGRAARALRAAGEPVRGRASSARRR